MVDCASRSRSSAPSGCLATGASLLLSIAPTGNEFLPVHGGPSVSIGDRIKRVSPALPSPNRGQSRYRRRLDVLRPPKRRGPVLLRSSDRSFAFLWQPQTPHAPGANDAGPWVASRRRPTPLPRPPADTVRPWNLLEYIKGSQLPVARLESYGEEPTDRSSRICLAVLGAWHPL